MTNPSLDPNAENAEMAHRMPLRLGSADDFSRVESSLRNAGFDEATILRVLKIEELADLSSVNPEMIDLHTSAAETLSLFIQLFLFSAVITRGEVERLIDSAALTSFQQLDILRVGTFDLTHGSSAEAYYSPVFLYPVAGLLIASDRHNKPDGSVFVPPPDIVFPAINAGTVRFLQVISKRPAEDALDLCSGTGVAALMLSKHVERVVASDITARATHFARFNRLLNRCDNVEAVEGDLFSPVEGRTFDRIVAHPPYVPSLSGTTIYRDGGETGEKLVRAIVQGLPRYLRPGGTYYSVCLGLDTREGAFEERVREWLGESREEFDVLFAFGDERSPSQFATDIIERSHGDPADRIRWDEIFSNAGVRRLVYGALIIHRRDLKRHGDGGAQAHNALTMRTRFSTATDGACFDWAFRWREWRSRPDALEKIVHLRPRLAPLMRVDVTHRVREGSLTASEFVLKSEKPFATATKVDSWVVSLIAEFDGGRTTAELHQAARSVSALPDAFTLDDMANMVGLFIERGYLEVDDSIFKE